MRKNEDRGRRKREREGGRGQCRREGLVVEGRSEVGRGVRKGARNEPGTTREIGLAPAVGAVQFRPSAPKSSSARSSGAQAPE